MLLLRCRFSTDTTIAVCDQILLNLTLHRVSSYYWVEILKDAQEPDTMIATIQVDAKEVNIVIFYVIPMTTKITEHKLNGRNYLDWSKIVQVYLRNIEKDDHLTNNSPSNATTKEVWLHEDAKIFLQIQNFINSKVIRLVNHCEFVKDLMDYLAFLYSGKGNVLHIYNVCKEFIAYKNKI